jgi:nicotinic acid phosphoribosyltransferase
LQHRGTADLGRYIDTNALQADIDALARQGFLAQELAYLAGLKNSAGGAVFAPAYLDYLATHPLPAVRVSTQAGQLQVETSGAWQLVTFWETVVMSAVNQHYFAGFVASHERMRDLYAEGTTPPRRQNRRIAG